MFTVYIKSENGGTGQLILQDEDLPNGLGELEVTLSRHNRYHGIFPSVSSKLSFDCNSSGYNFILAAYNEKAIDMVVKIEVYQETCGKNIMILSGTIEADNLVFKGDRLDFSIQQGDCTNLLLDRLNVNVNLYDEPCLPVLTYDKTAILRRYTFAPYLVNFPEKKILGWAQGVLNDTVCNFGTALNPEIVTTADFFVGLGTTGKSIFVCDGGAIPCGYSTACDNYTQHPTPATTGYYRARVQEARIRNFPPIKWLNNDLNFANEFDPCQMEGAKMDYVNSNPPIPQLPFDYGQGHTGWIQEFRREEYNIVPPSIRFDLAPCGNYIRNFRDYAPDIDEDGELDKYKTEPVERLIKIECDCQEIKIKCRATGKQKVYFFASQGSGATSYPNPTVEYVRTTTRARLFALSATDLLNPPDLWTDLTDTYDLSGVLSTGTWTGVVPCTPLTLGFEHYFLNPTSGCGTLSGFAYFTVGGTTTWQDFDTGDLEFHFNNCELRKGDCLFFALETDIAMIVDDGSVIVRSVVLWETVEVDILYSTCDEVGETNVEAFAVHESLARLVEYYTNNCLTVRTSYFGRTNSLEGADDSDYQNRISCYPPVIDCPLPSIFTPEYLLSFQTGTHSGSVCPTDGCGAYEIITSGNLLREWTKACYTNLADMVQSLDAIHNIGIGYSDGEPGVIRVERYEYFYKQDVVMEIEIDLIKSKYSRSIYSQNYYKKYVAGYTDNFIKDYVNSIDEFNTRREYTLPITNTSNSMDKRCLYIASGYTIEYQRRQRYTSTTDFDSSVFIVCVESDMLSVELGINNPSWCGTTQPNYPQTPDGIIDPLSVYNWRIRPQYNAARNLSFFLPTLWRSPVKELRFSFGEVHYNISGDEPGSHSGCDVGYDYVNSTEFSTCEASDVSTIWVNNPSLTQQKIINEMIEFNYPLTPSEFELLRSNPYSQIKVNGERFYIMDIKYSVNRSSKLKLIKAF